MDSFWEYLGNIISGINLGAVIFVVSLLLAAAAYIGAIVALIVGTKRIARRDARWNFAFVPAVVIAAIFVIIFSSWLGIEVSPNV